MISQLSFFHLGHVTMKDAEPDINEVYSLLEVGLTRSVQGYMTHIVSVFLSSDDAC